MKKAIACIIVGIIATTVGSAWSAEEATATAANEVQSMSTNTTAAVAPVATVKATDAFMSAGSKMLSLSYGYVTTDYDDVSTDADGWRINASFEMNPTGGSLVHGLTVGYIETSADGTFLAQPVEYEVQSIPIYYAPKIILGKKAIKVFAKGSLGCQFSEYSRSGAGGSASYNEFGFYGGGSLGAMLVFKGKVFINAEYEWVYMSNAGYQTGSAQSAMFGIGAKF